MNVDWCGKRRARSSERAPHENDTVRGNSFTARFLTNGKFIVEILFPTLFIAMKYHWYIDFDGCLAVFPKYNTISIHTRSTAHTSQNEYNLHTRIKYKWHTKKKK